MAEGIVVGSVGVDVVPVAERFWAEFQAKTAPGATRVGQDIGRQIGAPIAEKIGKGIGDGLDAGGRTVGGKGTKAGEDFAGAFARTVKTRIEAALKSLPKVELHAESTDTDVKIAAIRAELEALSSQRIGIDVDEGIALAQLDRMHEELTRLGAESPTVSVGVNAGRAAAELAAVQAEVDKLAASRPTVTVDVDAGAAQAELGAVGSEVAAVGAASSASTGSLSGLVVAGILLAPAIVPAAAAAAAGIAGIGAAALAGVAGIGVLVLAGAGVIETVKAMTQEQAGAGRAAAAHAAAQLQVAGAVDQVRAAEAALANTRANAADSAARAAEQVRAAEANLTAAQQQARLAQLDLTRAREAARQALEDLAAQTVDAGLAQRQANLDQIRAKADLDKVLADPHATAVQRQQAQLTYEQAVQQHREATTRQQRLTQQKKEADAAGIAGSQQVLTAQNAITAAQQRTADAQTHLGDAHRAQDAQARQSAYAITQAQQQVVTAHRSLSRASVESSTAGGAAMAKLHAQIAAQPPAIREFAAFLLGLKPVFKDLQATAAGGLLPGVETGLEAMQPLLGQFKTFLGGLATTIGGLFADAGRALNSPFWRGFFDYLGKTAGPYLKIMASILGDVARGFAGLLIAFQPVTDKLGVGIANLAKRFADWAAGLATNKGFKSFIGYVQANGPKLLATLGAVVGAVVAVAKALAEFGGPVLAAVKAVADAIRSIPTPVLTVAAAVIGVLVVGFWALTTATAAWSAVMDANPIGLVVIAIVALVAGLVLAYKHFAGFRRVVDETWHAIVAAATWAWNTVLKPVFTAIANLITHVVAPAAVWLWRNVITPAFHAIGAVIGFAWEHVIQPALAGIHWWISHVVGPVFSWLWHHVVAPTWEGIKVATSVAWAVVKVVFGLLQIAIKAVGTTFFLLWTFAIKPVWEAIGAAIGWAWTHVIKPVLSELGDFISKYVAPAFETGVKAIGTAWDKLRDVAKKPVGFVLHTVIEDGLLAGYNVLARTFHVSEVHLPKSVLAAFPGFAAGGITPGWSPGRDIHHFYSPTAGWLSLAGGEPIMRPEFGAAVGHGWIHAANAAAGAGGVAGVRRFLGGYAGGGVLPVLPSFGYDTGAYRPAGLSIGSAAAAPALTVDQLASVRGDGGAAGGMTLRLVVDDGAVAGLVRVQVDEAYGALANALVYDTH